MNEQFVFRSFLFLIQTLQPRPRAAVDSRPRGF